MDAWRVRAALAGGLVMLVLVLAIEALRGEASADGVAAERDD